MLTKKYQFVSEIVTKFWHGDPNSVELVRESANIVFKFRQQEHHRFLRISNVWHPEKILSAIDFLRYSHANGAPVYEPIASVNGRFIEPYTHHNSTYLCRTYESIAGETLTHRCTSPIIYEAWGHAIAQLHEVAVQYRPDPNLYFWSRKEEWDKTKIGLSPNDAPLWQEFELIDNWFKSNPPIDGGFGITHADCNAGNFIWNGRTITIIDFDEPMVEWMAADVARPFLEVLDFPLSLRQQLMAALVKGYRGVRPLDNFTVTHLPWFIRFKALSGYAWEIGDNDKSPYAPDMVARRNDIVNPLEW